MTPKRLNREIRVFFGLLTGLLLLAPAGPKPASADASGAPTQSLPEIHELREMERAVETRHTNRMREIQDGLTIQSYDSDTALMLRIKADQEYKTNMEQLRLQEQDTYRAMDAKQARSGNGTVAPAPVSPAVPRFESQSIITYPQSDPAAQPTEETPRHEGQQKNVGFGTRELEF